MHKKMIGFQVKTQMTSKMFIKVMNSGIECNLRESHKLAMKVLQELDHIQLVQQLNIEGINRNISAMLMLLDKEQE